MVFLGPFQGHGVLEGDTPDELFTAWPALPDEKRNGMEAELPEIFEMSCEKAFAQSWMRRSST
jgi:hypothetical protein